MASKAKTETRIFIIEETPAGDRARFTVPVGPDAEAALARVEARVAQITSGNPVRLLTVEGHAA